MDSKISETSTKDEVRSFNPSPEDQRRYEIAVRYTELRAQKELIDVQVKTWSAKKESVEILMKQLEQELDNLKEGQMVLVDI